MTTRISFLALAALLLAVPPAHAQKRDRNVITQEEIVKAGSKSTTQLIRKLRPIWLSSRGAAQLQSTDPTADAGVLNKENAVAVYVDGMRRGTARELDDIPVEQIGELRFYSAEAATTRFGMGNDSGAIEIITKK